MPTLLSRPVSRVPEALWSVPGFELTISYMTWSLTTERGHDPDIRCWTSGQSTEAEFVSDSATVSNMINTMTIPTLLSRPVSRVPEAV